MGPPSCTAHELYRRHFPFGHQVIEWHEWESWSGEMGFSLDDPRLYLLYSGYAALASSGAGHDEADGAAAGARRGLFEAMMRSGAQLKLPQKMISNCPLSPPDACVSFVVQSLAARLSNVSDELVGFYDSRGPDGSVVRFARPEVTHCSADTSAIFLSVPSDPRLGFGGIKLPKFSDCNVDNTYTDGGDNNMMAVARRRSTEVSRKADYNDSLRQQMDMEVLICNAFTRAAHVNSNNTNNTTERLHIVGAAVVALSIAIPLILVIL